MYLVKFLCDQKLIAIRRYGANIAFREPASSIVSKNRLVGKVCGLTSTDIGIN
jgi:hypothetical protein